MQLFERVHLVGSGSHGFGLSHPSDCHVYAIDDEAGITLVDAGCGLEGDEIVAALQADGLDPSRIIQVLITHYHADHCGGAYFWAERFGARIVASPVAAAALRSGDEEVTGLAKARPVGIYPEGYRLRPCAADECTAGSVLQTGRISFHVIDTPGHCRGHRAFHAAIGGRHCLFSGDSVFYGGTILIQNIPDCVLSEYCDTVLRLATLPVDALLPGHFMLSLRDGHRHLDEAARLVRSLRIPPNAM